MAAKEYKIAYKNHCTPQEYITENSRWYLDSDVGAKLTGTAVWGPDSTEPTYATASLAADAEVLLEDTGYDFYYVKNTSATGTAGGILISMADEVNSTSGGTEFDDYRIFLGPGECFASKVSTFASLQLKGVTATHTYEYIKAT
tara:strand:- start:62 stop:493 length:432 start_codon:yes stop_codon:yes gene_type:complete